ncbi:lyase [Anaeramoeba flamelloides]|uniref:Lyase n=1 Tax=Anaeramoeba flamelloides TaxID=1746091 RepID=A0AAV7Z222_9EUKA|nr:lyase [Anaeramoeba flamelloides]
MKLAYQISIVVFFVTVLISLFTRPDSSRFGKQIVGIQHIGVTIKDWEKSLKFYVEGLGGKPLLTGTDFKGMDIQNILFQKELKDALKNEANFKDYSIPNFLKNDRLDAVYIQYSNTVIELLRYYDSETNVPVSDIREMTSPAIPSSQHIAFHVVDNIDLNDFVNDLEEWSHENGMENVGCNRLKGCIIDEEDKIVCEEAEKADKKFNSLKIQGKDKGDYNGWFLAYCKGPNGEQLEFNQVLYQSKKVFQKAYDTRPQTKN